jgi:hypothetical protein
MDALVSFWKPSCHGLQGLFSAEMAGSAAAGGTSIPHNVNGWGSNLKRI